MEPTFIARLRESPHIALFLIFLALIISFAANLYGLFIGVFNVIPHLFYIPIILAAFFYPRRGVVFAVIVSLAYLLSVVVVHPGTSPDIISAAARCVVFVIIAGIVSYLSERVSAKERALIRAKDEWENTFNGVPDLIAIMGKDHRILRVNRAMAEILGITAEQAVGLKCYEIVHSSKSPPVNCPYELLFKDGKEHSAGVHEDKLGGDFVVTVSPLHDTDGTLIGSIHIARDVTEQKKIDEALNSALRKLNMLSSITRHDILNQVTGLRTYLELSREDLKGTRYAEFIEKEDQAAEAIQRQIEFTRYYQDIGVNAPKWQDAGAVIREAAGQFSLPAIDLQVAVEGVEIFADPLIVKVFFNLMENSLRHGMKVTEITFTSHESSKGLVITYRDNGVGISTGDKEKLFQRGFGKHTGLGLFLSREILAITGITIAETGVFGDGVRFEMVIPAGGYRFTQPDT